MSLKVGCLPHAICHKPSKPMINHKKRHLDDDDADEEDEIVINTITVIVDPIYKMNPRRIGRIRT